jgi:hypothetical protein
MTRCPDDLLLRLRRSGIYPRWQNPLLEPLEAQRQDRKIRSAANSNAARAMIHEIATTAVPGQISNTRKTVEVALGSANTSKPRETLSESQEQFSLRLHLRS